MKRILLVAAAVTVGGVVLSLFGNDDVDREAIFTAFKELKLNIGSDGSFSGSGQYEIPLNDYKKEVTEETEHNRETAREPVQNARVS